MLIITNPAEMMDALASPIADTIKRILLLRGDLIDLATFVIPGAGDSVGDIERIIGMPPTDSFEWVLDHGGAYEAPYIVSDDGSGFLLIMPDNQGIDATLIDVLRSHAQPAEVTS